MDGPSVLFADGLPFVFETFVLIGQSPPLAQMLGYYDTLEPIPIDTTNAGHDGMRFRWRAIWWPSRNKLAAPEAQSG